MIPAFTSTSTSFSFPSLTPPSNSSPPPPSVPPQTSPEPAPSDEPPSPSSNPPETLPTPDPEPDPEPEPEPEPEPSETPVVVIITSGSDGDQEPRTILVTSTSPGPAVATNVTPQSFTSARPSSRSSDVTALAPSGGTASNSGSEGLTAGGKIAVAVVVPVAAVALIVLACLFLWRRRKQRKDAEELRRKEVEEYGYNPNNDQTLPAIGVTNSNENPSEMREPDKAGYRGWGTTSTARKPSTTLSSNNGQIGVARSDSGSNPGGYQAGSPTAGTDVHSNDPLVGSPGHRPETGDSETIGALGGAPVAGTRTDRDIHRGPSNASSAYSTGHRSELSADGIPGGASGQPYYDDGLYYDEGIPQHGPYGDGSFHTGQPVIRDVQARRNTRIENPSVFPQQGNAGIAQNF